MSTEFVPFDEAFEEGDRERAEKLASRLPQMARIRAIGGPLDGSNVQVPVGLLTIDNAEIPLALPRMSETLFIPGERIMYGVYRLDRSHGCLRYERAITYGQSAHQ